MGEVQVILHVEHRIPPAENKVHRLSMCHDIHRGLGIAWNRSSFWYAPSLCFVSQLQQFSVLTEIVDYLDQQDYVEQHFPGNSIYNNDFIGIFSYNIFVGVYVATIFGSAFFFDLFWPQRYEAPGVKLSWKICSILAIMFTFSAALGCTIILATHSARVTGPNSSFVYQRLNEVHPNEPLDYKHNTRGIISICFLWPGFIATIAS